MDLPEGFSEPNGPAFVKKQFREGPPLEYVAEKLHWCVEAIHQTYRRLNEEGHVSDELLEMDMQESFQKALTAYLALNNLLGMAEDPHLFGRLLKMSCDDFESWLEDIRREGSVV